MTSVASPAAVSPPSLIMSAGAAVGGGSHSTKQQERLTEKDFDFPNADPLFLQQWSCVPVVCSIAESETLDGKQRRCQFIVPRQSFLYHYAYTSTLANICNAARNSGCRWFSYRCQLYPKSEIYLPLPIQYPVHTLCDLVSAERGGLHHNVPAFRAPLMLRIHFSEPKKEDFEAMCATLPPLQATTVLSWDSFMQRYHACLKLDSVRCASKWLRHTLRQNMLLRFGSCDVLKLMERDMSSYAEDLTKAVVDNQADVYWRARSVMEQWGEMQGRGDTTIYVVVIHYSPWQTQRILWRGGGQKLGVFLKENVEGFAGLEREQCHSNQPCQVLFVQGLNPLLSTPMDALMELLSSTDLVLHITLKSRALVEQFVES